MSSYEKVVKLACKPKAAPPKAKYIDTIIAATYSEDGAVHDVCKALAPKFREPNAIIVFKALIVLHTMVRNGATDNVLGYLSQMDVLRLRNVSNGQWEGYTTPQNLANYAHYLDYRIRAYKDLKHDPIRVQSETNRDMRIGTLAVDEDGRRGSLAYGSGSGPGGASMANRRQTIVGRKLRIMTVEKGLLRETKIVQKMIDSLLACKFYLDDLEDELTITALRILVKDLLVLFQACNEGVINLLENYFEMAYTDASTALTLYRHFCVQTESVVEYLTIARKLENLLNVPIPSLKHAPVSLAGSLEEYLQDPNFEQNRIEYKTNKETADKNLRAGKRSVKPTPQATEEVPPVPKIQPEAASQPAAPSTSTAPPKIEVNKELADFFASIEPDQPNLFNQQAASPAPGQSAFNPFNQQQPFTNVVTLNGPNPFPGTAPGPSPFINAQATGMFGMPGAGIQQQATGFPGMQSSGPFPTGLNGIAPQPTAAPTNAFLSPSFPGVAGSSPFARPASAAPNFAAIGAGANGLLQPQSTGANPFRQSILESQATGSPFGGLGAPASTGPLGGGTNPWGSNPPNSAPFNLPQQTGINAGPFGVSSVSNAQSPFASAQTSNADSNKITPPFARPASTPITITNTNGSAQPLTSQMTGSRNPFGRPKSPPPPPVPPVPTIGQLAAGFGSGGGQGTSTSSNPWSSFGNALGGNTGGQAMGTVGGLTGTGAGTASSGGMSSVASEFAFSKPNSAPVDTNNLNNDIPKSNSLFGASSTSPFGVLSAQTTSTSTSTSPFSAFSAQATGSSNATSTPSISALKPQPTGFGGSIIKPFKPASSFGASLLDSLPTIPQGSTLSTPTNFGQVNGSTASSGLPNGSNAGSTANGLTSQPTGFGMSGMFGSGGVGPGSGPRLNGGLQPQMTGGNPFRASMFSDSSSQPGVAGASGSTTMSQQQVFAPQATGFGSAFGSSFGSSLPSGQNGAGAPSFGASLFGGGGGAQQNGLGASATPPMPGAFPSFTQQPQSLI
ncbi:hypothetical protein FRB94_006561 [Tulasnella sp. JGI-2019a]|nr:hypothetical protein FRB93_012098 [Tulasnella sp. JGI-2019a]KAG9012193.1 hypothetical protein FRB94_006561 [Tulasnella sp. JGI-2019a]KAG9036346.1 hypothetical protein FRB95_009268 [Tulasnella sp. JGI-2019a]